MGKNKQLKALKGQHPQVRRLAIEKKLDAETFPTEHSRRWTFALK